MLGFRIFMIHKHLNEFKINALTEDEDTINLFKCILSFPIYIYIYIYI
jgi:hypothetical protein